MILRGSISNLLAGEVSPFRIRAGSTMPLPSAAPTWGAALSGFDAIRAAARIRAPTALHRLGMLRHEGAGAGEHRAGLAREKLLAAGDQPDARVAGLHDGQRRLAHDAALDGTGQHGLLRRVDAHRHDFDIGPVGLGDLPEPVLQRRVGHRAGGLGGEARCLARRRPVRLEGGCGARARREELRQRRRCDEDVLGDGGRRHHPHIDAARARHRQRRDSGEIEIDRPRGEGLDHVRARLEHGEARGNPRFLEPALALGDEDRSGPDDRDVTDPGRDGTLGRGGVRKRRGRGERGACEQELTAVHGRRSSQQQRPEGRLLTV